MADRAVKLWVATTNAGKLRDFAAAAVFYGVQIEPLPGLKNVPAPEEDGATFEANARLKAEYYSGLASEKLGIGKGELVLADDSGLEVDILNGAPGVRSARYAEDEKFAGSGTTDERNNACLLAALDGKLERGGRYRCALAVARDGVVVQVAEGAVEGEILGEPVGNGGFGYDPLFWLPDEGLTMADMPMEARQKVSHRGRALINLLEAMGKQYREV